MSAIDRVLKAYPSLSRVFIQHPKTACVVALFITIVGCICLSRFAVAEYPNITQVTITVSANYTGASAKVLSESVGQVIEDQINGVEDIWYYKSKCNDKGAYNCYCVFRPGVPSNIALVNVQNAVKRAEPKLPAEVKQSGISVKKRPEDNMLLYMFMTDGREMDILELSNFVEKQILESVARVEGVGLVESGARQYAMRIWLDPIKLAGLNISIDEIQSAIESQNIQAASGTIGSEYANSHLTFKLNVKGRLMTKDEFENIIVRTNPATGAQIKIGDIARVELGCNGYTTRYRFVDNPAASIVVYKAPEANAIATAERVKKVVDKWMERLPPGVTGVLADDATAFTKVFLLETFWTLVIALGLVIVITYIFLQDWRATFIPAIAIPISLLGTFAFLYPLGYTINVLTMFGLILVIGSLVDDAIVVVENAQSLMQNEGLSAKEAAAKSMSQITGPVIATTLVTLACYVPLVFYGGMIGMMYVQFAVTMCISLMLSTVVALVLSPVLCMYLLRAPDPNKRRIVFVPFNWMLDKSRGCYLKFVKFFVRRGLITVILFIACGAGVWLLSGKVPTAFLPKEDRGKISMHARLSEGQSMDRTIELIDQIHEQTRNVPGVEFISSNCGSSGMWGSGENLANATFWLKHWDERTTPETQIDAIMERLKAEVAKFPQAEFIFSQPAAIRGLGGSSGVGFNLCSLDGATPAELLAAADGLVASLSSNVLVKSASHGFTATTPQMELKLDRAKAELLGLTPKMIFATLQNQLASFYVNDFNIKGGVYQVKLQNESEARASMTDVMAVQIPSSNGGTVPLSSIASIEYVGGCRETMSYNKLLAAWVDVTPADGVATSEVMDLIEATPLPKGFVIEWGPVAMQEKENEGRLFWLMCAALLFAYLFLVAQYESWTVPISVMLSVIFAVAGAYLGLWLTDTQLSVYAQLGCVMLIGLAAKNAILMVEFSKQEHESGKSIEEAAVSGADLRYRAVMMTAWSFIIGVLPLVFASGAGSGAMRAIGICTCSGMLASSIVGIIFVPALYALFQRMRERIMKKPVPAEEQKA